MLADMTDDVHVVQLMEGPEATASLLADFAASGRPA
jgi:hypothetical protein